MRVDDVSSIASSFYAGEISPPRTAREYAEIFSRTFAERLESNIRDTVGTVIASETARSGEIPLAGTSVSREVTAASEGAARETRTPFGVLASLERTPVPDTSAALMREYCFATDRTASRTPGAATRIESADITGERALATSPRSGARPEYIDLTTVTAMPLDDLPGYLNGLGRSTLDQMFTQYFPGGHPEILESCDVKAFIQAAIAKRQIQAQAGIPYDFPLEPGLVLKEGA